MLKSNKFQVFNFLNKQFNSLSHSSLSLQKFSFNENCFADVRTELLLGLKHMEHFGCLDQFEDLNMTIYLTKK